MYVLCHRLDLIDEDEHLTQRPRRQVTLCIGSVCEGDFIESLFSSAEIFQVYLSNIVCRSMK
jgi:hypothetical protein